MNLNVGIIMPPGPQRDGLVAHVSGLGCAVRVADHADEFVARSGDDPCEVALLDFPRPAPPEATPPPAGEAEPASLAQKRETIRTLKDRWPKVQLVVLSERASQDATETLELGIRNVLLKPLRTESLDGLLRAASRSVAQQVRQQRESIRIEEEFRFERIQGESPAIREAIDLARRVAASSATSVLILGESGVGKELFARAIHGESPRKHGPFMEVNCAAIPRELLESELFGHEKGAFTDARAQKLGLLELANAGTLFLDEIGEMSAMLQVKLLRVLERRTFKRVGGTKDITVNVRVISATNQDLERMVAEGHFREDLYYRLKVVPLYVPPLRERREDVIPLARLFMDRFARQFKKPFRGISAPAEQVLLDYPWPGNIRELKNLFERTVLLENAELLEPRHLKLAPRARPGQEVTYGQRIDDLLHGPVPAGGIPFEALIEELERALIVKASCATKWNQSRTAELLQLKRDKLRYRMKLYELESRDAPEPPQDRAA